MKKVDKILSLLNEGKYTKASLKKDIANGKITGYISWDEPSDDGTASAEFKKDPTYRKVVLGTTYNTQVEGDTLVIGTGLMSGGTLHNNSYPAGTTDKYSLWLGSVLHVELKIN